MWGKLIPDFIKLGYQVITVDLPGHGKTIELVENGNIEHIAHLVKEILDQHKISGFITVGHSMGGYVGLELLQLLPSQLILLHSNFWEDPPQKKIDRNRVIEVVKNNKNLIIKEAIPSLFAEENRNRLTKEIASLIKTACKMKAEAIVSATIGMRDRSSHYNFPKNTQLSIIHGQLDPIIPAEILHRELKKLNIKPKTITIANCGHMSIWEQPQTLIAAIKQAIIE